MTVFAERSERYDAWVAPMRPVAAPWRVVLGLGLAGGVWLAAMLALVRLGDLLAFEPGRAVVLVFLASFAALILGFALVMRAVHGLPGARLLGAEGRLEGRWLVRGVLVVAVVIGATFVPVLLIEPPQRQLPFATWALWLPLALPALAIQVTAEEIAFRGYLQGMLAARYANRLVWWVLPALLFGALHWNAAEFGENAWLMVAAAVLMGLVFGDVTARTGSLALAVGLHFANNAFALLVLATPSALSGLALYRSPLDPADPEAVRAALIGNMALIAVGYGVFLAVVWWRARRRAAPAPRPWGR